MSKKIIYAMILMLSALLITGCSSGGSKQVTVDNPYIGGSQGLIPTFEPMGVSSNGGTQTVYDNENIPIQINIKNKGEYTVPSGQVTSTIKGISSADYTGITFQKTNDQDIEKISEFNTNGGETTIDHGNGKLVDGRLDNRNLLTANIFAEIIYPYQTYISAPKVCFRDASSKTGETICQVDNAALQVFSSGAPIRAVSAKEIQSGKGLVSFEFTIENAGGGESKKTTSADFDYRYNEIGFSVKDSSNPSKWDCKSSGQTGTGRFDDANKLTILCKLTQTIGETEAYQSELGLTLDYDYKVMINSDLVIKNHNT